MDAKKEIDRITTWMKKYAEATSCKGVVLGISGGKDSTVVAMLAKKVFANKVIGIMMPNGTQADINDSKKIINTLELNGHIVNINSVYKALLDSIDASFDNAGNGFCSDKSLTNIPPRLRMTILYAVGQTLGYRVIGTGNASEAYVGWCTKYGDCGYDFNPIAHLTKTEVVEIGLELAKEFGLDESLIVKAPSDGLTGKSDEDNLGFTYDELDKFIETGSTTNIANAKKFLYMHRMSEHKRRVPYTINDDFGN